MSMPEVPEVREFAAHDESVSVRWGAATDVGRRRTVNEDSVFAAFPVFLVADGMGGHDAGDVASSLAIGAFQRLKSRTTTTVRDVEEAVFDAMRQVEQSEVGMRGGGTTLSGACLVDIDGVAHWLVLNVGDSRTYLLDDGELEQLSVDHSVVQELLDAGRVAPFEARNHPHRNVITKAIGGGASARPDYWIVPASAGQRVLICSDGLSGEIEDNEIARVLRVEASPAAAARTLIHAALLAGAPDNVSVIVVDVDAVAGPLVEDTGGRLELEDTLPSVRGTR